GPPVRIAGPDRPRGRGRAGHHPDRRGGRRRLRAFIVRIGVRGMKMITANRLTDGRVLYWTAAQGWTPNIDDAAQVDDANADSELALALKDEATEVAGPYLIEAADGRPA